MAEGDLQKRVGRNLRTYRLDRGLSQETFAEQLGIHRTYLGGLERGERNITFKTLEQIAEQLELRVDDLLRPNPHASTL